MTTMKRRTLLKTGAAVAATVGFPWPKRAKAAIELKLSHYLPPVHGLHVDFMEPWAQELEKRTDGAVKVTIFPGGTPLGNVAKQYDQCVAGVVDIAHGLRGIPGGRFPRTSIIELPFMCRTADGATRALWALFPKYLEQEHPGVKVLALHAHNPGLIHTRDRPVRTMEDLRGLRLRVPSTATTKMVEYLGGTPVGLPPAEIYENLQKGVIDGLIMPWDPIRSFRLVDLIRYHLEARCYTVSFYFVMNRSRYESLPDDIRAAVDAISGDNLIPKFGPWWDKWDEPGRQDALKAGNTITELTEDERQRWREALQPMIDAYLDDLEKNQGVPEARQIYADMREAIARIEG